MESYKVIQRLGVGTYGSAYLVSLKKDPAQQYVLKKVKIDEDNEKEKQQAEMEVVVLAQLDHPLILRYVDHFMYKGHLCIVTDYCEAGDLYSYLRARKSPLPEAQILDWFVQAVLAIQYVHSKNILHRDLKTQNLFLRFPGQSSTGIVTLGDFGISRPLSHSLDLASTIIGTPYYMSPEVMSSQPYDHKSDMWSLGCCLYEMMSLKHAFDASDMSSLVLKIMRGEHLPIPTQYSPDLRDLVKSLLSKNPKMRPSTDAILAKTWLKEYVARARDKVRQLGAAAPAAAGIGGGGSSGALRSKASGGLTSGPLPSQGAVKSEGVSAAAAQHQRRQSHDAAPAAAAAGKGGENIDKELQAAKDRLKQIQAERQALAALSRQQQQQQQHSAAGGHAGSGRAPGSNQVSSSGGSSGAVASGMHRHSNSGMHPAAPLSSGSPPHRPPLPPGGVSGGAAPGGAGRGAGGVQRSVSIGHQDPSISGAISDYNTGGRHARSHSRDMSPDVASAAAQAAMDPKARKEARRQEEMRQREAELLEARKAYFEERKQAQAKQWHMIHGGSSAATSVLPGNNIGGRGTGGIGLAGSELQGLNLDGRDTEDGHEHGRQYLHPPRAPGPHHPGGYMEEAAQEFEDELSMQQRQEAQRMPVLLTSMGTGSVGLSAPQRAAALKELCVSALGPQLFDLLYSVMHKRMAQEVGDEAYFRQELLARLGPHRMQYLHLVDQLLYYEDAMSRA